MFQKIQLDFYADSFETLQDGVPFETVCKGRKGAILVDLPNTCRVPLVRSTTPYLHPPRSFSPIHHELVASIQKHVPLAHFNNALIEIYDHQYKTMGMHSDQAQDLADDSFIALFSCYQHPQTHPSRKLMVQNKGTKESHDIVLDHNSVVLFSLDANRRHTHKIYLDRPPSSPQWLGITLRLSKTFVNFASCIPMLHDGLPLRMIEEHEKNTYYKMRGTENKEIDFAYPQLNFTLSPSDLIPPLF